MQSRFSSLTTAMARGAAAARRRILVVDDDEAVGRFVERRLTQLGYEVVFVARPREALDIAAVEKFDLLLTDIVMPQKTGVDLAAELGAQSPRTRVLYMSAFSGGFLSASDLSSRASLLKKPFTLTELGAAVARSLG